MDHRYRANRAPPQPREDPYPERPRFFARFTRAQVGLVLDLACPRCGALDRITRQSTQFDPVYQRWQCGGCKRKWLIGITAEPVSRQLAQTSNPAVDMVPTLSEAAQLRGLLAEQHRSRWNPRNRACSCAGREFFSDYNEFCPLHRTEDKTDVEYQAWRILNGKLTAWEKSGLPKAPPLE